MPVPVIDPQKRSDAYKKVSPVAGIAEQGLVPDPDVMHTLFSRYVRSRSRRFSDPSAVNWTVRSAKRVCA